MPRCVTDEEWEHTKDEYNMSYNIGRPPCGNYIDYCQGCYIEERDIPGGGAHNPTEWFLECNYCDDFPDVPKDQRFPGNNTYDWSSNIDRLRQYPYTNEPCTPDIHGIPGAPMCEFDTTACFTVIENGETDSIGMATSEKIIRRGDWVGGDDESYPLLCEDSVPGCTDESADNHDVGANTNNGSCTYPSPAVPGCMDPLASNFDTSATVDNETCEYYGCTDPLVPNFIQAATIDDGTCDLSSLCDTPSLSLTAGEYGTESNPIPWGMGSSTESSPHATIDISGGTENPQYIIETRIPTHIQPSEQVWHDYSYGSDWTTIESSSFGVYNDDGYSIQEFRVKQKQDSCDPSAWSITLMVHGMGNGCMTEGNANYDPNATIHNENACEKLGCNTESADNYDSSANLNDGSCIFSNRPDCLPPTIILRNNTGDRVELRINAVGCSESFCPGANSFNTQYKVNDGSWTQLSEETWKYNDSEPVFVTDQSGEVQFRTKVKAHTTQEPYCWPESDWSEIVTAQVVGPIDDEKWTMPIWGWIIIALFIIGLIIWARL